MYDFIFLFSWKAPENIDFEPDYPSYQETASENAMSGQKKIEKGLPKSRRIW